VGEEARSFGGGFARGFSGRLEDVEDAMPSEGEQIQRRQRHGEERLAVPENGLETGKNRGQELHPLSESEFSRFRNPLF
jgi:hypothetical protein